MHVYLIYYIFIPTHTDEACKALYIYNAEYNNRYYSNILYD